MTDASSADSHTILDDDTVDKVARLTRLRLTPSEHTRMKSDLSAILGWVSQLSHVDTDGVTPMASLGSARQRLRGDGPAVSCDAEQVLKNAPERVGEYFVVPKVIE